MDLFYLGATFPRRFLEEKQKQTHETIVENKPTSSECGGGETEVTWN